MIADWVKPKERARYMGLFGASIGVGLVLAGHLYQFAGAYYSFGFDTFVPALLLVVMTLLKCRRAMLPRYHQP